MPWIPSLEGRAWVRCWHGYSLGASSLRGVRHTCGGSLGLQAGWEHPWDRWRCVNASWLILTQGCPPFWGGRGGFRSQRLGFYPEFWSWIQSGSLRSGLLDSLERSILGVVGFYFFGACYISSQLPLVRCAGKRGRLKRGHHNRDFVGCPRPFPSVRLNCGVAVPWEGVTAPNSVPTVTHLQFRLVAPFWGHFRRVCGCLGSRIWVPQGWHGARLAPRPFTASSSAGASRLRIWPPPRSSSRA